MKKFLILLSTFLLIPRSQAAVCFDPFADATSDGGTSYTAGSYLFGQGNGLANGANIWYALTNLPAPPATGFPRITAGNLSYPGIPVTPGNCASIPADIGVMGRLTLNFTATNGQAYFAFLLKVLDLSAVDTTGTQDNFFAGFGDTAGNQNATLLRAATRIYTKKSGSGYKLGVARNTGVTGNWVFDSTQRATNDVLLVIGSYDYDSHTANLWINPSSNTWGSVTAPTPTITATKGADLNANGIHAFVLGCRTNSPPGCLVDDLRIGTSWALVTGGLAIGAQPSDQMLKAGMSCVFQVVASGAAPLVYQWRKNGAALADGAKYSGAAAASLTISNLLQADSGSYSVRVSNGSGAITSLVAMLTVIDPAINAQPISQALPPGSKAVFTVSAGGTGPLTCQWLKNGVPLDNAGNISGADSAALTVGAIAAGDAGMYSVSVKNSLNQSAQSVGANLYLADPALPGGRPNIIFILCDDLGYGDMGILFQNSRAPGQPKEATPNLDTFAAEGMQLRQHYCPAPVCAPSRASLMLGLHQGHANVRDQQYDKALANNHTLASVLRTAGYATALVGKWGLGGDDLGGTTPAEWPAFPTKRGFDYFFGYERHADGHDHYPKEAIYSNKSKECYDQSNNITPYLDKCYTADLFTARAKKWITDQHSSQPNQPFFLYLAFDTPHSVYELPAQAYPAGGGANGGAQWLGDIGHMINTASGTVDSFIHPDYANATYDDDGNPNTPEVAWPEVFKRFATSVRRIDDAVGDVKKLLQDLGIETNTLVIFTSDNGPTTEDELNLPVTYTANFFDNFGPMDGVKRDTWEGGIRMPAYVRWPGKIAPGTLSQTPSQSQDWMPTFAALAGLPAPAHTDGVSLLPTLLGIGAQQPSTIYVEYFDDATATPEYPEFVPAHRGRSRNQMQVIGLNGYQGVRYNIMSQSNDFEIYDVAHDLHEATNLALNAAFTNLQQQMKDRVLQLRRPDASAPRPYDNELIPAAGSLAVTNGILNYETFAGAWPWVPDVAMLSPISSGQTAGANLAVRPQDTNYAVAFDGYIRIPNDGNYTFYLTTDAGALLRLHDAIVIDDDFTHTGSEASGSILLKAGWHPIHLVYRHSNGASVLDLEYSGPGLAKQPVPISSFGAACPTCLVKPQANNDSAITLASTPVMIDVLANDSPASLAIVNVTPPLKGGASIVSGKILYTPNSGFLGDDQFAYTITDGTNQATATVRVAVCFADGNYWFPFNETGGFTTTEAGGFTVAQLQNYTNDPAQWVTGRYNRALSFDGTANFASVTGFDGILGSAQRTCAAWVKTSATGNIPVIAWGPDTTGNKWTFLLEGGNPRLEVTGGWVQSSHRVNDGQWHHLACVLPSTGSVDATNVQLYIDGIHETVLASNVSQTINTGDAGEVKIGGDVQGRLFKGIIDEVHLYNYALDAAEIASLYAATNQSAAAWLRRYFGNAVADWNSDSDGDGASLWAEYAFGGQPLIADTASMQIVPALISGQFQIQYNRRLAGTSELVYQLQYSTDLNSWSALPGTELFAAPSATPSGFEEVTFAPDASVINGRSIFVRLAVLAP